MSSLSLASRCVVSLVVLVLLVVPVSAQTVSLSWDPPVVTKGTPPPDGYVVYRRLSSTATFTELLRTGPAVTTTIDEPPIGHTWVYVIRAYTSAGVSDPSNDVTITLTAGKVGNPRNLTITVTGTR